MDAIKRKKVRAIFCLSLFLLVSASVWGCVSAQSADEWTQASAGAVAATSSGANALGTGAGQPPLNADWDLPYGVLDRVPSETLHLVVTNIAAYPIDGDVTIRLAGIGVVRTVSLGKHAIAAHSSVTFDWTPSSSAIRARRTSVSVQPFVKYTVSGVTVGVPGAAVAVSFSEDMTHAFVSLDDNVGVRLASLGRRGAGPRSTSVSDADRAALIAELGSRRGVIDGVAVEQSAADAVTSALAARHASKDVGGGTNSEVPAPDTLAFDGPAPRSFPADQPAAAPAIGIPIQPCISPVQNISAAVCSEYQITTYTDVDVTTIGGTTTTVPQADHDMWNAAAAYVNAAVYVRGSPIWSGRLDGSGCTPVLSFCPQKTTMSVTTDSVQVPTHTQGSTFVPASRDIRITPVETYFPAIYVSQNAVTHQYSAVSIVTDSYSYDPKNFPIRVAAVASRAQAMADNGLGLASSTIPLNVHTEVGCYDNDGAGYTEPDGGHLATAEACTFSDGGINGYEVFLGYALDYNGVNDPGHPFNAGPPSNQHLVHTTEELYTIAHEMGHATQYGQDGGPSLSSFDYGSVVGQGHCSCDYVNVGNQIHCLDSKHQEIAGEVEGFAHFFATRITNDKDSVNPGSRFNYYKQAQVPLSQFPACQAYSQYDGYCYLDPPVPINAGVPYGVNGNGAGGWVRNVCSQPIAGHASEYDFLTFLWAVNGNAPIGTSSLMPDLYAIFGDPSVRTDSTFTWNQILTVASAHYGPSSAKYQHFNTASEASGVDL